MEVGSEFIVDAVLAHLKSRYPSTRRYREEQDQNTKRPCYLVSQLNLNSDRQMYDRVKRNYRIRIVYLGSTSETSLQQHLRAVGDSLLEAFQKLPLADGRCIFGRNLEYEVVNGELQFTGEFPMHLIHVQDPRPQMHTLGTKPGLKSI